jgi:NlpC/P60 family
LIPTKSAFASDWEPILRPGEALQPGQQLLSDGCNYVLTMQDDGNLVEYSTLTGDAVWASGTEGHPGTILINQFDGNIVLVAPGNQPIWSTNTEGYQGTVLILQNDANVVAYAPGNQPIWASEGPAAKLPQVVQVASAIENGQAEPGWNGGAVPYSWGGGHDPTYTGPSYGTCYKYTGPLPCEASQTIGVDCSGFVRWVYSIVYGRDVLPGNTDDQLRNPLMQPVSANLAQPGDLVFYGYSAAKTEHVGIYIGQGQMIDALHTGTTVETDFVSTPVSGPIQLVGYYHYTG